MYVSALSNRVQLSVYDDHFLFSALSDSSALTSCHVVVKKKKLLTLIGKQYSSLTNKVMNKVNM